MQAVKQRDSIKDEIKNNVTLKIDCLKNRGSKIYALNTTVPFT